MEDAAGSACSTGKAKGSKGKAPEMVTTMVRRSLVKQGYTIVGSHSGVKLCRWTKAMLRGRGGCYKHTFYGIQVRVGVIKISVALRLVMPHTQSSYSRFERCTVFACQASDATDTACYRCTSGGCQVCDAMHTGCATWRSVVRQTRFICLSGLRRDIRIVCGL